MFTRRTTLLGLGAAAASRAPALASPLPIDPVSLQAEGRYLPLYAKALAAVPHEEFFRQTAAWVGDEAMALAGHAGNSEPDAAFETAQASDALTRIVAAAKGRRVVFLNEAHVASRHRMFLIQVLRALRTEGFTHLSAEDFLNTNDPAAPDIRGWRPGAPFNPDFGWYMRDPVFAEAVREAVELGYRLERHEQRPDQKGAEEDGLAAVAVREQAQADNLAAILAASPQARILVYVGYAHLRETADRKGSRWCATRLAEKTGIDPLTVEQALTGGYGPHAPDCALAKAVQARFSPTSPIVVQGSSGIYGAERMGADLAVFHPVLPDVDGRPGWLAADVKRRRIEVSLPVASAAGLRLVQALHTDDAAVCIPADHCLVEPAARRAVLFVRPGRYRLRLETEAGFTPLGEVSV